MLDQKMNTFSCRKIYLLMRLEVYSVEKVIGTGNIAHFPSDGIDQSAVGSSSLGGRRFVIIPVDQVYITRRVARALSFARGNISYRLVLS